MSAQDKRGWASVLGEEVEPPADEKTDPNLSVQPPPEEGDGRTDPVLDALAEADEGDGAKTELARPALQEPLKVGPPAAVMARNTRPAPPSKPPAAAAARGLQLQPPRPPAERTESSAQRLKLPTPRGASGGGGPAPPAPSFAADPAPGFSTDGLVEKLSGPTESATPAGRSGPVRPSVWSEYKEVILSILAGGLLLGGVLVYQRTRAPVVVGDHAQRIVPPASGASGPAAPPQPPQPPPPAPPPTAPVPSGPATPPPAAPSVDMNAQPPPPARTASPMLSVMSTPSGAKVRVDGALMGTTPLILPVPVRPSLQVRLEMDKYRMWEQEILPNEAGHYSVTVRLEPK